MAPAIVDTILLMALGAPIHVCAACGYPRVTDSSERCPECGSNKWTLARRGFTIPWWHALMHVAILLMNFSICAFVAWIMYEIIIEPSAGMIMGLIVWAMVMALPLALLWSWASLLWARTRVQPVVTGVILSLTLLYASLLGLWAATLF